MALVDLENICKGYFVNKIGHSPGDISYSELKLKVVDQIWTPTLPTTSREGQRSSVRVERQDPSLDAYGAVNTSRNNEFVTVVDIHQGGMKGLTKRIKLPLPPEMIPEVGESVEIDISKQRSEIKKGISVNAQTGQQFPRGASVAEATVTIKDSEYQGHFKCKVMMSGPVVFIVNPTQKSSVQIGEIVDFYNSQAFNYDGLSVQNEPFFELEVQRRQDSDRSQVVWTLEGSCEFRWATDQTITWVQRT